MCGCACVRACERVHAALKHIRNPGISELSESAAARWDGAGFTKRDHAVMKRDLRRAGYLTSHHPHPLLAQPYVSFAPFMVSFVVQLLESTLPLPYFLDPHIRVPGSACTSFL